MFRSFYAVTKDRKGGVHQYRLTASEGVPRNEEIVDLRLAGQFGFDEFVSSEDIEKMYAMTAAPAPKKNRRKRAPKE